MPPIIFLHTLDADMAAAWAKAFGLPPTLNDADDACPLQRKLHPVCRD
jgi:hypothetical protein